MWLWENARLVSKVVVSVHEKSEVRLLETGVWQAGGNRWASAYPDRDVNLAVVCRKDANQ